MVDSKQQPGTAATTRDDFRRAAETYENACNAWRLAAECLRAAKGALRAAQLALEDAESIAWLDDRVDGSNKEKREAQIQVIMREAGNWQADIDAAQGEVRRWEDNCTAERDRISGSKRVMEFATAYIGFISVEGATA